jgi:hypothetical protein
VNLTFTRYTCHFGQQLVAQRSRRVGGEQAA